MASSSLSASAATPETMINLKINLDGVTRRLKLPLRDLGPNVFEDKLRDLLHIPSDISVIIERYSDSATSFVLLHRANISVYKQLYRAAKAKQKLKLRVTTTTPAEPVKDVMAPKPVTIEDEPEEESRKSTMAVPEKEAQIAPENKSVEPSVPQNPQVLDTVSAPGNSQEFPSFVKEWQAQGYPKIHLRRDADGVEVVDFLGTSTATGLSPDSDAATNIPGASPVSLARMLRVMEARSSGLVDQEMPPHSSVDHIVEGTTSAKHAPPVLNLDKTECEQDGNMENTDAMQEICAKTEDLDLSASETTASATQQNHVVEQAVSISKLECMKRPFTVCCNSCDRAVPEAHFHCSICDEGDFDLCQECVNRGISCYGDGHWLIKRTVVGGDIKCSSTHVAPKSHRSTPLKAAPNFVYAPLLPPSPIPRISRAHEFSSRWNSPRGNWSIRTCNSCVQEFHDEEFVHCSTCDDYDLCKGCFAKNQHGHHPKHGFTAAVNGTTLEQPVASRLAPGRNVLHNAICDGCDKYVRGIRHKCLDCPDWDYCSDCVKDASFVHANHRFVPIYEPLADRPLRTSSRATHYGISCDGPLCSTREPNCLYIVGERYKCAVCHDTDFCANCEASPANTHNKTHPLIKFKTPVRHVSVTTTGEHEDGHRLPTMGDRCHRSRTSTQPSGTRVSTREKIAATPVQTVVDVQPSEQPMASPQNDEDAAVVKEEAIEAKPSVLAIPANVQEHLVAVFKWDTIQDGSILPPNQTFEQTWVIRNEGNVPWPAGCSVKFVGGDYMGAVDPAHPAGIHELVSASESTICYNALNPGQEFPFTVLMRTPDREGKVISYWRLTTPDGIKFGHKLWCDVAVKAMSKVEPAEEEAPVMPESKVEENDTTAVSESHMIIPKLEHESPSSSVLVDERPEIEVETETETVAPSAGSDYDDFEDCGKDDWAEDDSASGFMTDEEYDILDASDEEFLFDQQKTYSQK